jgi:hypothetical protein
MMAPFDFRADIEADRIPLLPLLTYLRVPADGRDTAAMARSCYRVARLMVSWAAEARDQGAVSAFAISRLDLARRFRAAGQQWRARGMA